MTTTQSGVTMASVAPVLPRATYNETFGLDCEEELVWEGWQPGGEMVKKITIKNISLATVTVKYRLPSTKFFHMEYPETFKLPPGISRTLEVFFRPTKYEPYVDYLQMIVPKKGAFSIVVKALVKQHAITIPELVDFGLCPVKEDTKADIIVFNTGSLPANFAWRCDGPFTIFPTAASIPVGSMERCVLTFHPERAEVYDASLFCDLEIDEADLHRVRPPGAAEDEDEDPSLDEMRNTAELFATLQGTPKRPSKMVCTGIGKFPHLQLPDPSCGIGEGEGGVSMGDVLPGVLVEKKVVIDNVAPVQCDFEVTMDLVAPDVPPLPPVPFTVYPERGTIYAQSSFTLTVRFQSNTVRQVHHLRYKVTTKSGPSIMLHLSARVVPVEAKLSTYTVNFGDTFAGERGSRTFQLANLSPLPLAYHIVNQDSAGVLAVDRPIGIVPPTAFVVLTVVLNANTAGNYVKRLFVVCKGAEHPLPVDVIATVAIRGEPKRPAPLCNEHLWLWKRLQLEGFKDYDDVPETHPLLMDAFVNLPGTAHVPPTQPPSRQRHPSPTFKARAKPFISFSSMAEHAQISRTSASRSPPGPGGQMKGPTSGSSSPAGGGRSATLLQTSRSMTASSSSPPKLGWNSKGAKAAVPMTFISDGLLDNAPKLVWPPEETVTEMFLEMTLDGDSPLRDVSISPMVVDFRGCSPLSMSESRVLSVTNRSRQKMTCLWLVPGKTRNECTEKDENFPATIYPLERDILPGSSCEFQIQFRPSVFDCFSVCCLEALVYPKKNRTFRLVDISKFTPPLMVSVSISGHSFVRGSVKFIPVAEISESLVQFRPCAVGQCTFHVIQVHNRGDTPLHYKVIEPELEDRKSGEAEEMEATAGKSRAIFRAWPHQGLIPALQFHLLVLEFRPREASEGMSCFSNRFRLAFNYEKTSVKDITVLGRAWKPAAAVTELGADGITQCFPPTCSGLLTTQPMKFRNPTETPMELSLSLQKHPGVDDSPSGAPDSLAFSLPIPKLIMDARQLIDVPVVFSPPTKGRFYARLSARASHSDDPTQTVRGALRALLPQPPRFSPPPTARRRRPGSATARALKDDQQLEDPYKSGTLVLDLEGAGLGAGLVVSPRDLDFGAMRAFEKSTLKLTIMNASSSPVNFVLDFQLTVYQPELLEDIEAVRGIEELNRINSQRRRLSIGADLISMAASDPSSPASRSPHAAQRRQQTRDPDSGGLGTEEGTALLFCPPTDSEDMGDIQPWDELTADMAADALTCEKFSGRLEPRHSTTVKITLKPPVRGQYVYMLKVVPVTDQNPTPLPQPVSPKAAFADGSAAYAEKSRRRMSTVHSPPPAGGGARMPAEGRGARRASFIGVHWTKEKNIHATKQTNCVVKARVVHPFVRIVNCRSGVHPCSPSSLWEDVQADALNRFFRMEASQSERAFEAAKGIDARKALLPSLAAFTVNVGRQPLGAAPSELFVTLRNPGLVPCEFAFLGPKTIAVEKVPLWAQDLDVLKAAGPDENAFFEWVEEQGIITVTPEKGCLQPDEQIVVKFRYSHETEGSHVLPVVLAVADGRCCVVHLFGSTLPLAAPRLTVRSTLQNLQPVPVGVNPGVVQAIQLANLGDRACRWWLDPQSLKELSAENFHFPVVQLAPAEGTLVPQQVTHFHVVATPVEAKAYSCRLMLNYCEVEGGEGGDKRRPFEPLPVEIQLEGFDPRGNAQMDPLATLGQTPQLMADGLELPDEVHVRPQVEPFFSPHIPQWCVGVVPGLGAAVSVEHVEFPPCPPRSVIHRIVALINFTDEYSLAFEWDQQELFGDSDVLQIEPASGFLEPRSHCLVSFVLHANEQNVDVSGEVACRLVWGHAEHSHGGSPSPEGGRASSNSANTSQEGDISKMSVEKGDGDEELIARHKAHRHFVSFSDFVLGKWNEKEAARFEHPPRTSVVHRLTFARYRHLISTEGGQRFLQRSLRQLQLPRKLLQFYGPSGLIERQEGSGDTQGLRRGSISQSLGASSHSQTQSKTGGHSQTGGPSTSPFESSVDTLPSEVPIYVRVTARVGQWIVRNPEARRKFLVLPPLRTVPVMEQLVEEAGGDGEARVEAEGMVAGEEQRRASEISVAVTEVEIDDDTPGESATLEEEGGARPSTFSREGSVTGGGKAGAGKGSLFSPERAELTAEVFKEVMRSILEKPEFFSLCQRISTQDPPVFKQLRDSPPPSPRVLHKELAATGDGLAKGVAGLGEEDGEAEGETTAEKAASAAGLSGSFDAGAVGEEAAEGEAAAAEEGGSGGDSDSPPPAPSPEGQGEGEGEGGQTMPPSDGVASPEEETGGGAVEGEKRVSEKEKEKPHRPAIIELPPTEWAPLLNDLLPNIPDLYKRLTKVVKLGEEEEGVVVAGGVSADLPGDLPEETAIKVETVGLNIDEMDLDMIAVDDDDDLGPVPEYKPYQTGSVKADPDGKFTVDDEDAGVATPIALSRPLDKSPCDLQSLPSVVSEIFREVLVSLFDEVMAGKTDWTEPPL